VNSVHLAENVRDGPTQFLWLVSIPCVPKALSSRVKVQVSARIDVLVEKQFSGSTDEHEVPAQFRPEHLFQRRPVRVHACFSAFALTDFGTYSNISPTR
jgi:hypothetical protein